MQIVEGNGADCNDVFSKGNKMIDHSFNKYCGGVNCYVPGTSCALSYLIITTIFWWVAIIAFSFIAEAADP